MYQFACVRYNIDILSGNYVYNEFPNRAFTKLVIQLMIINLDYLRVFNVKIKQNDDNILLLFSYFFPFL